MTVTSTCAERRHLVASNPQSAGRSPATPATFIDRRYIGKLSSLRLELLGDPDCALGQHAAAFSGKLRL
jgi:hypothetical protein